MHLFWIFRLGKGNSNGKEDKEGRKDMFHILIM